MDSDAQLLLAFDLDDCAVGQVILEHHINPVTGSERRFNMRDSSLTHAEFERMTCNIEL
jgi:hypothetical protein